MKAEGVLPVIIVAIISSFLNRAGSRLGTAKPMGFGHRYWRVALYVNRYKKLKTISLPIVT